MARTEGPLIFLVAGEPSGDLLGARLMASLKAETGGAVRFAGLGGPLMEGEGLKSLFDIREIAVMGLVEIIGHLPTVLRRMRDCREAALAAKPDAFISIDSPGFSLRVSERLKGCGFPLIHYVAPSVWAWRRARAKRIAAFLDHLLCLLPFEPPYFEEHGLQTTFVGHPAVEAASQPTDPAGLRTRLQLKPDQPLLCVLPGSRAGEIKRLAGVFGGALGLLAERTPELAALVPTVPTVASQVSEAVQSWPVPTHVLPRQEDKYSAFAAARAALAASGTVGIELAVAGLPAVMAYRLNWLSAEIARRVLTVKHVSIASLVLDRRVQPEILQDSCTPQRLAAGLLPLIEDSDERARIIRDGFEAARLLGQGGDAPSLRAARAVLQVLQQAGRPDPKPLKAS